MERLCHLISPSIKEADDRRVLEDDLPSLPFGEAEAPDFPLPSGTGGVLYPFLQMIEPALGKEPTLRPGRRVPAYRAPAPDLGPVPSALGFHEVAVARLVLELAPRFVGLKGPKESRCKANQVLQEVDGKL